MATSGNIVTSKGKAKLADGFVKSLSNLLMPGNVSAMSCMEACAEVLEMVNAFAPKVKNPDDTRFEVSDERGTWTVKFGDLPAIVEHTRTCHREIAKANTLINRPDIPSTRGAKKTEVDKTVPELDALF